MSDQTILETANPNEGVSTSYFEQFSDDFASALRQASEAGDAPAQDLLRRLWFDFFEDSLHSLSVREAIEYLENRAVWRKADTWPVYKTAATPCLAFTATVDEEAGKVNVVALGICYRYPVDDEEVWWRSVILPRLRRL